MKKRAGSLLSLFLLLLTSFSFPISSQAKVIVKSYQELKEELGYEGSRQIEIGADISLTGPITIRGSKKIDGKGHVLERSKVKGRVYGGTMFLMLGTRCDWENVTVSGAGKANNVVGKVFGRLLEARQGKTILGSRCIWKNNINDRLAVDGGGALWVKKGAQCHIQGGEISHNENVSRGAGVRVEKGAQLVVEKGRLVSNVVRGIDAAEGFEGLGAAIYNEGKVTIKGGSLEGNRAIAYTNNVASYGGAGGAVYNRGDCTIMGGAIRNNRASQRGSAVYSDRHASTKLSGGSLLSNWDAENRPIWLGGSCILDKNVSIQQLYISPYASAKVKKSWSAKKKVVIEPSSYDTGRCILHGAKGNFELKAKSRFQLVYKKNGYYIEQVKKQTKKPATSSTASPTVRLTRKPTASPTVKPTASPTVSPTASPTASPTVKPTASPTASPTANPTEKPKVEIAAQPHIRFTVIPQTADVVEEWHFSSKAVQEIQRFMDGREDPFSQETNQEFMRRFQKYRREGLAHRDE